MVWRVNQKRIKLIDERDDTDKKIIQEAITSAERIFFLGFGYLKENLEVLGLPISLNPTSETSMYGTKLNMNPKRMEEVHHLLASNNNAGTIIFRNVNSYDLLDEFLWE